MCTILCPSDEIGKHARLKIVCRKACGFNSHLGQKMIEYFVKKGLFKNASHAVWFFASVGFFALTLTYYFLPNTKYLILLVPLIAHLPPLITAYIAVYIQKRKSDVYTKNCIWFNAVMIFWYCLLIIYIF